MGTTKQKALFMNRTASFRPVKKRISLRISIRVRGAIIRWTKKDSHQKHLDLDYLLDNRADRIQWDVLHVLLALLGPYRVYFPVNAEL